MDYLEKITEGKSKATIKTYKTHLSKLYDLNENFDTDNVDNVINDIKNNDFSISAKLMLLNVYILVKKLTLSKDDAIIKKLEKTRDKLKTTNQKQRIQKNKVLDKELPTYDEYKNYLTNLYNNEEWRDYIVNYLIFNYNVRNGDLYLKITDNKQDLKNKDVNYLYLLDNDIYYIRNVYKTNFSYGQKRNRISGKKFRDAVINYLNKYGNTRPFLFYKTNEGKQDENITYDNIGYYVKEITLNKIGEGNIMKLILKYYDNNSNYNKIKQISKNRGTDIETLLTDYNLNTKN